MYAGGVREGLAAYLGEALLGFFGELNFVICSAHRNTTYNNMKRNIQHCETVTSETGHSPSAVRRGRLHVILACCKISMELPVATGLGWA